MLRYSVFLVVLITGSFQSIAASENLPSNRFEIRYQVLQDGKEIASIPVKPSINDDLELSARGVPPEYIVPELLKKFDEIKKQVCGSPILPQTVTMNLSGMSATWDTKILCKKGNRK